VFQELAMEEMEHQAKLELELMKLGRVVRDKGSGQGPHVTRMQSLDDIPADLTREEILLLALKKEAAAFRLYVEMLALAKDDHVYELLFALSEEEMRHKLRFERMYDALKARES
ncbi:MAG: hypothetical protein JW828_12840, partial [Sedimentisphaerales bacterium]|nr:hypothetical protein [Sedimentisphaerales bacterium]